MKRILLICLSILFSFNVIAQNQEKDSTKFLGIFPVVNKQVCYTEVIRKDSISKNELYNRALSWFANTFKSSKDVIQMQDKESGKIIGKGSFECSLGFLFPSLDIKMTIIIMVKDGRYKYVINNFIHYYSVYIENMSSHGEQTIFEMFEGADPKKKITQKNARKLHNKILEIIDSLKEGMNIPNSSTTTEDNDW